MKKVVETEGLKKVFNRNRKNQNVVLNDLNLVVCEGEFVCIMGQSGSGKTTLLNILSTIEDYDYGKVCVLNRNLLKISEKEKAEIRKSEIGFIFQNYNLLDTLTIKENINFLISLNNIQDHNLVEELCKKLDISDIQDKYPFECSGGQQQRATIARALISSPKIIYADEPTGNLDSKNSKELMQLLLSINKEYKTTIIMVTHDCQIASYANRVYYLLDGAIKKTLEKNKLKDDYYLEIVKMNAELEIL